MIEKLRKRLKEQKGFTLIELLVVVIIIGLLAAIAIPAFLGQRERAGDAASQSLLRNAATAAEAAFADGQTYVQNAAALEAIEPNIDFLDAAGALSKTNQVSISGTAATTYTFTSTSTSGRVYVYAKNLASTPTVTRTWTGSGGTSGTW